MQAVRGASTVVRGSAGYDKHLRNDRFERSSTNGLIRSRLVDGIVVVGSEWLKGACGSRVGNIKSHRNTYDRRGRFRDGLR